RPVAVAAGVLAGPPATGSPAGARAGRRPGRRGLAQVLAATPAAAVLAPGPCAAGEAGILVPLVNALAGKVPVLGVCLGHQAIGTAFGGRVVRADRLMHGKTCAVIHEEDELFEGIPSPVTGMRYHSLVGEPRSLPKDIVITAWSADRPKDAEIRALAHRTDPP